MATGENTPARSCDVCLTGSLCMRDAQGARWPVMARHAVLVAPQPQPGVRRTCDLHCRSAVSGPSLHLPQSSNIPAFGAIADTAPPTGRFRSARRGPEAPCIPARHHTQAWPPGRCSAAYRGWRGNAANQQTDGSMLRVVLECRDDPVELAFEKWRNTPQPDHDLAAPHDVGAPSPDSPRPRKIGSRLP